MKTEGGNRDNPFVENTLIEHVHAVHFGGLVGILRCKVLKDSETHKIHRIHPAPSDTTSDHSTPPAINYMNLDGIAEDTGTHSSLTPGDPNYDRPTYTLGQEIKAKHYRDDYIEGIDFDNDNPGPSEKVWDKWGGHTGYSFLGLWNSLTPPTGEHAIAYFPDDGEQIFEAQYLGSTPSYSISWEHWPTPTFHYNTWYYANTWTDITNGQSHGAFDPDHPPVDTVIPLYNAEAKGYRDAVDPSPPHDHVYTNIEYPVLVSRKSEIPGFTDATGFSHFGIINRSGTLDHIFDADNGLGWRSFNDSYDDPLQCPWCFIKYDTAPTKPAIFDEYTVFLINFTKLGSGDESHDPPIPAGEVGISQRVPEDASFGHFDPDIQFPAGFSFANEFELKIYSAGKFTIGPNRTILNDKEAVSDDNPTSSLVYGPVTKTLPYDRTGSDPLLKIKSIGWVD